MRIIVGTHPFANAFPRPVLVIGTLDGVHLGHRSVLQKARQIADENGGTLVVMTFHPHPMQVVSAEHAPSMLQTFGQRCATLQSTGVDVLWVLPFQRELAEMNPRDFARIFLYERLRVWHICVGHRFHFGQDRKGNIAFLQRFGSEHGFTVEEVDEICYRSLPIRSTGIRRLLHQGQVRLATKLLGRPPALVGRIVTGQQLGARLGFPTANLDPYNELLPKNGVYLTSTLYRGKHYPGITNIGLRPTIPDTSAAAHLLKVETHLLDFSQDIYGAFVELYFLARLRHEKKFAGLDLLVQQIRRDCARARRYFQSASDPFASDQPTFPYHNCRGQDSRSKA